MTRAARMEPLLLIVPAETMSCFPKLEIPTTKIREAFDRVNNVQRDPVVIIVDLNGQFPQTSF